MRDVPEAIAEKVMAAAALFADQGLDDTKMEDVAAATGVPKATLYYYFAGKEAILSFLFSEVLERLRLAVTDAAARPGDAAARLRAVVRAHLEVFAAYPAHSRALQLDLGRAARLPELAAATERSFLEPVRALLAEGATDGSLRRLPHPDLAALALLGAVTTVGLNTLTSARPRRVGPVADALTDVVLLGVAA